MSTNATMVAEGPGDLKQRLKLLGLHGVHDRFEEFDDEDVLRRIIAIEEEERGRRGLERRLRNAKLGRFKPFADFDWQWPDEYDPEHMKELFDLRFIEEAANVVLVGPHGIGKTMIAKNLAYQAILKGHTARFVTASELLNDLAAQETGSALTRKLKRYAHWKVLVIDEVGYLATSSRHSDLLFEVINRRYREKPIILTTNKGFKEWGDVFPSSTCVVAMVDRLIHKSEIMQIDGESYRLKEAKEQEAKRKAKKTSRKVAKKKTRRKS